MRVSWCGRCGAEGLDSKRGLPAYLAVQGEVVDLARLDPGNELLDKLR
jgi:hypothetical protein